jgi:hypothetical protein
MPDAVIYAGRGMSERVLWTRLRWRLRAAAMWPAFVPAVAVDAVLLHELPIAGDTAPEPFGAVLLAFFFNLVVVALGAPLAGRLLRRRGAGLRRPGGGRPALRARARAGPVPGEPRAHGHLAAGTGPLSNMCPRTRSQAVVLCHRQHRPAPAGGDTRPEPEPELGGRGT